MKALVTVLILALVLTGCSFSKQTRQQRRYEKYIRKSSVTRQKQRTKFFRSGRPQMPMTPKPSEPTETAQSGPEAVSTGEQ